MLTKKGGKNMKCLKIEKGKGKFINREGEFLDLDTMSKDDILHLLDIATGDDSFEMDDADEKEISNQAHRIIYQSLYEKFSELLKNKTRFKDESESIYKEALQKYEISN